MENSGTTKGGWDRYGSDGQKLGKCGDGKEGGAYATLFKSKPKYVNLVKKVEHHLFVVKDETKRKVEIPKKENKNPKERNQYIVKQVHKMVNV